MSTTPHLIASKKAPADDLSPRAHRPIPGKAGRPCQPAARRISARCSRTSPARAQLVPYRGAGPPCGSGGGADRHSTDLPSRCFRNCGPARSRPRVTEKARRRRPTPTVDEAGLPALSVQLVCALRAESDPAADHQQVNAAAVEALAMRTARGWPSLGDIFPREQQTPRRRRRRRRPREKWWPIIRGRHQGRVIVKLLPRSGAAAPLVTSWL